MYYYDPGGEKLNSRTLVENWTFLFQSQFFCIYKQNWTIHLLYTFKNWGFKILLKFHVISSKIEGVTAIFAFF